MAVTYVVEGTARNLVTKVPAGARTGHHTATAWCVIAPSRATANRPWTINRTTIPIATLCLALKNSKIRFVLFKGRSSRCAPKIHCQTASLMRQRIGPQLEVHHLRPRAFAGLEMKRRARPVGRPQAPALPAAVRIVDA